MEERNRKLFSGKRVPVTGGTGSFKRFFVAFSEFTSDAARRLSKPEIRSLLLRTGWLAS
jgi:FlaA1/EpsC-like NDP-sugar epimerase